MKEQCCVQENYGKVVLYLKIGVDYFLLLLVFLTWSRMSSLLKKSNISARVEPSIWASASSTNDSCKKKKNEKKN